MKEQEVCADAIHTLLQRLTADSEPCMIHAGDFRAVVCADAIVVFERTEQEYECQEHPSGECDGPYTVQIMERPLVARDIKVFHDVQVG